MRSVTTMRCVFLAQLLLGFQQTRGQFNEPPGNRRQQTFRVLEFEDGTINQRFEGTLRYYCTLRGKWSEARHPVDFPRNPSYSAPVLISHSNGYRMWTGTEACTLGVESIAEEGFATVMTNEFNNAGFETLQMIIGERMFNTTESQHMPPINVTFEHPFLSSMVKLTPSPDWFVGFSDFRTIRYETETFLNRVVIQSYVWDAGTDDGQTYTALDRDLDPQVPVKRFRPNNVPPGGQFLSPDRSFIPTPAEFECVLRVGEGDVIPGVPFNESHIRPPLYVPRPDDDWIGNPDFDQDRCNYGNFAGCTVGGKSAFGVSAAVSSKTVAVVAATTMGAVAAAMLW